VTESEHRRLHARCYSDDGRMKRCSLCAAFKPLAEFSRGQNNTIQGPCKPCKAAWARSSHRSRRGLSRP
jgi:hypothetical protein